MKSAEEIFKLMEDEMPFKILPNSKIKPYILEAIRIAQRDAIDEAVKMCAEEAYAEIDYHARDYGEPSAVVNKQSILQVADKLKQEIN